MNPTASRSGAVLDEQTERRLVWLLSGRLLLAFMSLVIAAGLEGAGRDLSTAAHSGLYWTVAFAFFATVVSGMFFHRVRRPRRFALVQIAIDITMVTSLVHFSGGHESVFSFLYVLVILYGALLFKKHVALGAATFGAFAYACALVTASLGWGLGGPDAASSVAVSHMLAVWCVHGGALFLVGALASVLSGELQRADDALVRSTQDFRQFRELHERMVESIMSGLLTIDSGGRVTSFNAEAERITGLERSRVLGSPLGEVIPKAWEELFLFSGRANAESARRRLSYCNSRGENLHLGLAGSLLRNEAGENIGHVVIFQDLTQVVRMEAELRRSERMAAIGELSAKIAHEIRNPLASISGSIEMLRGDLHSQADSAEAEQLMEIVMRETERLNGLISDFLLYARPAPIRREAVCIGGMLQEIVKMMQPGCEDTIHIDLRVPKEVKLVGDPDQLRQLFWNMCLNAVQAMPDGGTLRIEASRLQPQSPQGREPSSRNEAEIGFATRSAEADLHATDVAEKEELKSWIEVVFEDDGVGISEEMQDRIFEPFYTTKSEGTGLGLATVHRIVENHGGELLLDSVISEGTTFRVRLPGEESHS